MKTTQELIEQQRYHIELTSGIYFLFNDEDEIVYVGQSEDIHRRVGQHRVDKEYSSYTFIEESDPHLKDRLEKAYIEKFRPEYNKQLGNTSNKSVRTKYTGNKNLIANMYRVMKKNGYKSAFVYEQYKEKASYYCEEDLKMIRKKLGYKKGWIHFKKVELEKTDKWFEVNKEIKKAGRSKTYYRNWHKNNN